MYAFTTAAAYPLGLVVGSMVGELQVGLQLGVFALQI